MRKEARLAPPKSWPIPSQMPDFVLASPFQPSGSAFSGPHASLFVLMSIKPVLPMPVCVYAYLSTQIHICMNMLFMTSYAEGGPTGAP